MKDKVMMETINK